MTKPEKIIKNNIAKLPAVIVAFIVWQTDARERKIDIDAK